MPVVRRQTLQPARRREWRLVSWFGCRSLYRRMAGRQFPSGRRWHSAAMRIASFVLAVLDHPTIAAPLERVAHGHRLSRVRALGGKRDDRIRLVLPEHDGI